MTDRKILVACFRDDALACATLEMAITLVERARDIRYCEKWKNEGGCRLRRVEPSEMNSHPVFLQGEWGMDLGSFEPHDHCTRGGGILVVGYDYSNDKYLMNELKPRSYLRSVFTRENKVAGFHKLIIASSDSRFMGGHRLQKVLERNVAEAIYGAATDIDYSALLFVSDADIRGRL